MHSSRITSFLLRLLRVGAAYALALGASGVLIEDRLVLLECDSIAPTGILSILADQNF